MSALAIINYLTGEFPALQIAAPGVVDLPARKQQDAQAFFDLLKPVFTPSGSATALLHPLTALASDGARPLPDGVYGVVDSAQRMYRAASIATVITFSLEIRAASYAALVGIEDQARGVLLASAGVEAVGSADDYEPEASLYLSVLDVEMSAPVADVLVMEAETRQTGDMVCQDVFPLQEHYYDVVTVASSLTMMESRRDAVRAALTGWQESGAFGLLVFNGGERLPLDCGLFAWVDSFRQTENTG